MIVLVYFGLEMLQPVQHFRVSSMNWDQMLHIVQHLIPLSVIR
ncbi:hypothetical protein SAMN05518855_100477 [Paenibacillus sp. CF384]|nr:hypothetical protein SAMN05518855_100477 [Paenibacillus sp. CF384]